MNNWYILSMYIVILNIARDVLSSREVTLQQGWSFHINFASLLENVHVWTKCYELWKTSKALEISLAFIDLDTFILLKLVGKHSIEQNVMNNEKKEQNIGDFTGRQSWL